jgi:exopolysaccharide production protein ExoY
MTMNVSGNSLHRRWSLGQSRGNDGLAITAQALPVFHALPGDFQTANAEREFSNAVAAASPGGMPQSPLGGWPKRTVDIVIALSALILAAPVMIIVAVLIRATTGGPAMYSHSRVGFNGKPFNCYKFRSMVSNADQVLREHLEKNPQAATEWEEKRKLKRDPRITLFGMMLRKSSLDELPQLFNILRGDMSCVGPRPIVTDELKRYGEKVGEYLQTRPGLTGLWQVTGRSSTDYDIRVSLDSQYVRNWSLRADFVILLRTTVAVMRFGETS